MSNEITIQPATETDLPSIKPLLLELRDAMKNTACFDLEKSIENCRSLIKDPAHHMFVARDKDSIDELIIAQRSRNSGIGKQLILAAINKCREVGCCEVEVSTEKSNIQARQFYKACGFKEDAVLLEIDIEE